MDNTVAMNDSRLFVNSGACFNKQIDSFWNGGIFVVNYIIVLQYFDMVGKWSSYVGTFIGVSTIPMTR